MYDSNFLTEKTVLTEVKEFYNEYHSTVFYVVYSSFCYVENSIQERGMQCVCACVCVCVCVCMCACVHVHVAVHACVRAYMSVHASACMHCSCYANEAVS